MKRKKPIPDDSREAKKARYRHVYSSSHDKQAPMPRLAKMTKIQCVAALQSIYTLCDEMCADRFNEGREMTLYGRVRSGLWSGTAEALAIMEEVHSEKRLPA